MDARPLAFSGGGIRSATFCPGVAQVLARRSLFSQFDYMSTVSGGGYLGSFLSTTLGTGERTEADASGHEAMNERTARHVEMNRAEAHLLRGRSDPPWLANVPTF